MDGDGALSDGDIHLGTTDSSGSYSALASDAHTDKQIIAVLDGANNAGDPNDPGDDTTINVGTWRAPAGSAVVSPLTELLVTVQEANPDFDMDQAKAEVARITSLPEALDVTQYNPFDAGIAAKGADQGINKLDVMAATRQVGQWLLEVDQKEADDNVIAVPQFIVSEINDAAPTAMTLDSNAATLPENSRAHKLADITITDDGLGKNEITLSDTTRFEIREKATPERLVKELWLKAGVSLDYEAAQSHSVTLTLDGLTPQTFTLTVTDVDEAPTAMTLSVDRITLAENVDTASRIELATITITDADGGTNIPVLSDTTRFEVDGNKLYLKAGTSLNFETAQSHEVTLTVTGLGSRDFTLKLGNVDEDGTIDAFGTAPVIGTALTAPDVTDPDGSVTGQMYQWQVSDTGTGGWINLSGNGATTNSYTPQAADEGKFLRVVVTYTDGEGSGKTLPSDASAAIAAAPVVGTTVDGTAGDDMLNGTPNDDTLNGEAGNDTLNGGAGNDWLDGGAGADTMIGGSGNNDFVLTLADGARAQDIVTDFVRDDQIKIALSSADKALVDAETSNADRLAKLLELAEISIANNADHGRTSSTNSASRDDTVITFTGGGNSDVVMVLEDYSANLTFADFVVEVM